MQKFKFKLETVLKLREAKEKMIKAELGEIVKQINNCKDEIVKLNHDIKFAYDSQEKMIENVINAKFLEFFPYFVKGKKEHVKKNENIIYALQKKYEQKMEELLHARGDVKIIEKMKDKAKEQYQKDVNKHEQQNAEEHFMLKIAKEIGES